MVVKQARKARKLKKIIVKAPTKKMKKEIKSLRRGLKKEIALSKKVSKKASKQGTELELLKREIEKLKKRRKKAVLSAYNRFMRTQIKKGFSFKKAAVLWQRLKKAEAKKSRRRSAYNVFVSMQLKQGKTMKQAIRAWNKLKNPKPKRQRKKAIKRSTFKKRRIVKKRKALPKRRPLKRRKIKKTIVKKTVRGTGISKDALSKLIVNAFAKVQSDAEKRESSIKELFSKKTVSTTVGQRVESDEEIALRMLNVYFREVARRGLKRSLSLDEVINAYFYSLMRIQRKGIELEEICKIVKNSKF